MGRVEHLDDDPVMTRELHRDDRLVLVHDAHAAPRARRVLERRRVELLSDDEPRRPAA